jgi:hypothetical protein
LFEDKAVSCEVNDLMIEIGRKLDDSLAMVRERCSVDEFCRYREFVGRVMGELLLDVMNPIYSLHPDLKPPELG